MDGVLTAITEVSIPLDSLLIDVMGDVLSSYHLSDLGVQSLMISLFSDIFATYYYFLFKSLSKCPGLALVSVCWKHLGQIEKLKNKRMKTLYILVHKLKGKRMEKTMIIALYFVGSLP